MSTLGRNLEPIETLDKGTVLVGFSFLSNGSGTPATSSFKGDILSSVVRSAAGKWTCTLTNGAYDIIGGWVKVQVGNSDKDVTSYLGAVDLTAPTVVAYARSGGSASDLDTDDRVCVFLLLKKTSVTTRRT